MIRVLITGKDSYIGSALERRLLAENVGSYVYETVTLDMIGDLWKEADFSGFDVVFHVAAIVHQKEKRKADDLYFKVNRDLAYETALKAKAEGVKKFIFLSTMGVYGMESGVIGYDTQARPDSAYGRSKLEGERLVAGLHDADFEVAVLRPPMVYGRGCKGNYRKLAALVVKVPLFPWIDNKRSMIHIDNLAEFVRLLIDRPAAGQSSKTAGTAGMFYPQNAEYVNTSEMVKAIAEVHGRRLRMIRIPAWLFRIVDFGVVRKAFGDLYYEMEMSGIEGCEAADYRVTGFWESVRLTEAGEDRI